MSPKYNFEIIETGHVSRDDAAFPTLVTLENGDILCAHTAKGDGPNALGGTDFARSNDMGSTWVHEGTILPRTENPVSVNSMRLSRAADGTLLAYGEQAHLEGKGVERQFGIDKSGPVLCTSSDEGKTWTPPSPLPADLASAYEISSPILAKDNNTYLAPATTLADKDHLGERVVLYESRDRGKTWPYCHTAFQDPEGKKGFFEKKIIHLDGSRLLATAWTVTLGDYKDLENHFAISEDFGKTWSPAYPTGIQGQTLTPLYLGDNKLLCLSNRRYGVQGVVAYHAVMRENRWDIEPLGLLWDAKASRDINEEKTKGIEAFDDFAFGLPSAIRLEDNLFLAVHWCRENGIFGIKWTKFRL
ncbi:MAG: exo-alpha-sialidase [Bacteroidetes bacterium]|nr:exo-alpha-sialidase [Bacteroidota bacterium]